MPQVDNSEFIDTLLLHYNFPHAAKDQNKGQLIAISLKNWIGAFGLTLRDAEQALALCRLLVAHKPNIMQEVMFPCLFLCIARFAPNSDAVGRALRGEGKFADIIAVTPYFDTGKSRGGVRWEWLRALLRYADADEKSIDTAMTGPTRDPDTEALGFVRDLYTFPYGVIWRRYIDMVL